MKLAQYYSHMNGYEYLHYHKPHIIDEIEEVIRKVDAEFCKTKKSEEARKNKGLLYSPIDMNKQFAYHFENFNWGEDRVTNWLSEDIQTLREVFSLPAERQKEIIKEKGFTPIMTYNQTDFVKERVAVEVQFGKYSFVAHDLFVKHMAFYSSNIIDVGVEIVPMKSLERQMSSGVPYYERDYFNLMRQGRGVPSVPLILIGVEP